MSVSRVIIRDLFLLVLVMAFKKKAKCKGDCNHDNDGTKSINECCSNYHMVNGICKACISGFFGSNCSVRCPFPSYGLFCGNTCNCNSSESNHGCWNYGTTTFFPSTFKSETTYLPTPVIKDDQTEIASYQRTIHDDKFIVILSVTAVSCVIIVLTLVFTKFRCACNTKNNIIYHSQDTEHHMPLSMHYHGQLQVPFRNSETDVYLQIEEIDEINEISNTTFKIMHKNKIGAIKKTGLNNFSKPKPVSLPMREQSSSRTNFNNPLEPKPELFKKQNLLKKFEKYKTFTSRRLLYSKMNLKRYNSWHNVKDLPEILNSLKQAKSDLNIFHYKS